MVERARRELPATQLELELQAEVDKYVLLAHGSALAAGFATRLETRFARHGRFEQMRAALRRFYCAGQAEKIELARAA